MEWLKGLIEVVKLPIRYAWVIVVVSGLLLVLPELALKRIHVLKVVQNYDAYIGMSFLITAVIALTELVMWIWRLIKTRKAKIMHHQAVVETLMTLDQSEKAVLREFWIQGKKTIQCPINQSTVAGLMSKGILARVGPTGERATAGLLFPVKIINGIKVNVDMIDFPLSVPTPEERASLVRNRPHFVAEIEEHNNLFHKS